MQTYIKLAAIFACALWLAGCSPSAETAIETPDPMLSTSEAAPRPVRQQAVASDEEPYTPGTADFSCSPDLIANGLECLPSGQVPDIDENLTRGTAE